MIVQEHITNLERQQFAHDWYVANGYSIDFINWF